MLRVQAGRYPADPRMRGLVAELGTRSALFRGQWAEHRVSTGLRNRNVLNHPRAGRVEVSNELVTLHAAAENTLFLLIPDDAGSFTTAFRKFVAAARVNPLRHVPAAAEAPTSALREAG